MKASTWPWEEYSRLQTKLAERTSVDDFAWGLEAAMHRLLEGGISERQEIERTVRSESRRERNRVRLRLTYLAHSEASDDGWERNLEAQLLLRELKDQASASELELLIALAEGYAYVELARQWDTTPGALRVRASRLRRQHLRQS